MRRFLAWIGILAMTTIQFLPLTAMAAEKGAPPKEPYEKVSRKRGGWYENRMDYGGKSKLIIGYNGDYSTLAKEPSLEFYLAEDILLTGIYIPYKGTESGYAELTLEDSRGNIYQGFYVEHALTGGIKEESSPEAATAVQHNSLYEFIPENELVLIEDNYTLYIEGEELPIDAYLVKGYNYSAYKRYKDELIQWVKENEKEDNKPAESPASVGNEDLSELYKQFMENTKEDLEYEPSWDEEPYEFISPVFSLDEEYTVDEIILSTWNQGGGIRPGNISIYNEDGDMVATYRAQGASQGGKPNTLWVIMPAITLSAGVYYLDMDAPEALDYDASGEPVFYVGVSVPALPPTDFTGTYKIGVDLYKTHTLMGPVESKTSNLNIEVQELTILDKGTIIELIGQYEGMPFSQNCDVIEREEDYLVAQFDFGADLTNLPYKAAISANAKVTLRKELYDRVTFQVAGNAYYSRAASKEKGADENTYELTGQGGRSKKDLPPFVMAAIANAYGAGNIPGPDTPVEAAIGMLFPPLVGLVVSVLQGLLKPKELIPKLSVGEQAMKDANQSLGKGLVSEEEIKAWTAVADALGTSGGDAEDGFSIGDNELPGGADYVAPASEPTGSFGQYEGPDEDLSFGKPDPAPEAQTNEPYSQPMDAEFTPTTEAEGNIVGAESEQSGYSPPLEPESMVVQTNALGSQTLIIRDPATGGWINAESGNPFDLDAHRRNFPQQMKEYEDYANRNAELERTGRSAMQQALDDIDRKYRQEFDSIQKQIDNRRMEQLRRNQESLEWEQKQAEKLSGWGRIAGDWVVGMGNDTIDLARAGKDTVVSVGEKAGTLAGRMVYDPESIAKDVNDAYKSVKKSLVSAKDKVVGTAKEVYNKPWIAVKGVMETGKAAIDFATSPKKQLEFVKEAVGINDFADSWDPNLPVTERFKKVLSGTFKLGTTIGTAGTGAAAKTAAGTVGRAAASGARTASTGAKAMATRLPVKGIKPSLPVMRKPNYVAVNRPNALNGVSKTAQKVVQNVADDMGLQIKARTIKSPNAGRMIDTGLAAPKRMNMKAKTLSINDELLGGPKYGEELVGYYNPKLPPKEVWNKLHPTTKKELASLYKTRRREFRNLEGTMKDLQAAGEYKLEANGLVRDLKQGGKYVTSDLDIHDITNFDGSPVSESVKKEAYKRMMNYGSVKGKPPVQSTIMHEGTMSWKPESEKLKLAKERLIDGATKEGPGKGITSFNPLSKPTSEKYVRG
ncbi:MAG: hypothetical protein GX129_08840 [Clostridiales bacterium]|jgi:hypothetical protein|nr:hypothetical protein [Clostridiales bacterium]